MVRRHWPRPLISPLPHSSLIRHPQTHPQIRYWIFFSQSVSDEIVDVQCLTEWTSWIAGPQCPLPRCPCRFPRLLRRPIPSIPTSWEADRRSWTADGFMLFLPCIRCSNWPLIFHTHFFFPYLRPSPLSSQKVDMGIQKPALNLGCLPLSIDKL